MQLHETFIDSSTYLGNLSVTLHHIPCDVPKDHELYANKEQNCSEPWSVSVKIASSHWMAVFSSRTVCRFFLKRPNAPFKMPGLSSSSALQSLTSVISLYFIFQQYLTRMHFVWKQQAIMTNTPCIAI
jgi:hypothetical protein